MADKAFDAEHTFLDAVDDFTVLFHSDRVFVREQEYPVGQYVVDIMNLEEEVLDGVDQGMKDFYRAVRNVWREDTEESVHQAQEKLRPGGWLYAVVRKQQGAPSALKYLGEIFALARVREKDAGYWILEAQKAE